MIKKSKKKKKKFFFFFFFLKILGAKADPRYKRTRVITRRVLTGLTCTELLIRNFILNYKQDNSCDRVTLV